MSASTDLRVLISIIQDGAGLKTMLADLDKVKAGLKGLGTTPPIKNPLDPLKDGTPEALRHLAALEKGMTSVMGGLRLLAGGFLAFASVRFLKDLADTAARNEVLGTVLHVVGKNAGYATSELDKTDKKIQALGITSTASRQALTQFIQAGFDLRKAEPLAKAAQDAAVVLGVDSSEAFSRLVSATQRMDTISLRSMGIVIQREQAEQRFAMQMGKTAAQLTLRQRQEAFLDATIKKSEILKGTYTAAMGDVGKQLTSLTRLQDELKISVGQGLLPAYSALVQELTVVLKQMRLISDVDGIQTVEANKLATAVGGIAHALGQVAVFLAEHWRWVATIVTVWVSWKAVFAPLLKFFSMFMSEAAVGSTTFSGLVKILGFASVATITLVGWFVILGAIIITLQLKFERFNAAVGALVGVFITVGAAVKGAFMLALSTLGAAVKTVMAVIEHPFDTEAAKKPWTDWRVYAKQQIQDVADWWDLTKERFKQVFFPALDEPGGIPKEKRQEIEVSKKASLDLTEKILAAERKVKEMQDSPDPVTRRKAIDEYTAVKKAGADEKIKLDNLLAKSGLSPARQAEENKELEASKKRVASDRQITDVMEARTHAGITGAYAYPKGQELSQKFSETIGGFNTSLEAYNKLQERKAQGEKITTEDLELSTAEMTRQAQNVAKSITLPGDLQHGKAAIAAFRKASGVSASQLGKVNQAMGNAGIQVEREQISEMGPAEARRKALFMERLKPEQERLQLESTLLQSRNKLQADLDQESYTLGLMMQDEYFGKRAIRIVRESDKELEIAKNTVANLLAEQRGGYAHTIEEREELANRLNAATLALEQIPVKRAVALGANRIEATATGKEGRESVTALKLENAAFWGEMEATKAQIQEKYRLQHVEKDKIAGAQFALNRAEEIEVFQADLRFKDAAFQRELDAQTAILDVEQTRLDVARDAGTITSVEAMRRQNLLIEQRMAILDVQIAEKQNRVAYLEAVKTKQQNDIRQELQKYGADDTTVNTAMDEVSKGMAPQIAAATLETQKLITANEQLETQFNSLGKQMRITFTQTLGDAISQSLSDFRKANDAFLQMSNALKNQITGAIGANISEKLTKAIVKRTTKTNEDGSTSSIFDRMFSFMGLGDKDKKPTGKKGSELHVWVENPVGGGADPSKWGQFDTSGAGILGHQNFQTQLKNNAPSFSVGGTNFNLGAIMSFMNLFRGARMPTSTVGLGGSGFGSGGGMGFSSGPFAGGGLVDGPGTGTSDSIHAMVSAGEFITPAAKTAQFLPLLEGIRSGRIKAFKMGGLVQSIAIPSLIPRHYAGGGVVVSDGGSAAVTPGAGGPSAMQVTLHPDTMNMTMRDWLEHETVRQYGRR